MLHVERFCKLTYTLYVVLYLLSCSASNNLYYYLLSSPVAVPRVCVCVCVFGGGEESEFGNKCEKGKGKEGERRLSASVMNSPLPFVQG